jgi:ABC-type multidrug transport system ATPase subunit
MSENILKALLQLFAIIARGDGVGQGARPENASVLERFLRRQFGPDVVAGHMARYQAHVQAFHASAGRKRTSVNSVKVLRICTQVNEELTQRQKFVVLVHLLEFIHAQGAPSPQELEFVETVAETFNIAREEFMRCLRFVSGHQDHRSDDAHLLHIDKATAAGAHRARHLHAHDLDGELRVLHIPGVNMHLARYDGEGEVLLNGQRMPRATLHVLNNGCSIRPPGGVPIYYSDILGAFMDRGDKPNLVFRADSLEYTFPNGRKGLHELHLAETGGKLIGIMGGSGSGKSTLLNVLNGSLTPSQGRVTINGVDVHNERERIRGVIGHVSQDDLLIEELTVFQNLYYNAKLCFGDLDEQAITERVMHLLRTLGLYETRDLKVGSPLNKTISGGQRKRLNIALELIREPSVLFVDEPTSGLSSRDSENIMDLLKELALKGRLVFTVIHQPSSDIFKLFDRLLLMDQEGHPVYYGDPVDAVVYFKRVTDQANSDEGQCRACGNVNPEQIFNILEAKLVDEYGNETDQRRVGPEAWNEVFRAQMEVRVAKVPNEHGPLSGDFSPPGIWRQLKVFFTRDLLSKLANRQYVLINLVEAPALAFLMSFFLRFNGGAHPATYVFRENDNLPQYLFIAVIVALFLGLTVSAEEILRDRRILQREKFLALSWGGYLASKVGIMFLISALQTLLFVVTANLVLGIKDMGFVHWAVLFTVSCFANVLGLNVSASFNSAKVIYIIIPVLIIPQLLFSGIIVRFDKLHPWFSSQRSVPLIGNVMASRWAYEALAVEQFMNNPYERRFYPFDQRMKTANWKKDLWVRELQNSVAEVRRALASGAGAASVREHVELLRNELVREGERLEGYAFAGVESLTVERVDEALMDQVDESLRKLVTHYRAAYKAAEREKEALITELTADPEARRAYFELLDNYRNESLAEVVTNRTEIQVIVNDRGELVQKSDPVYLEPQRSGLFAAHFYAPAKRLAGGRLPTLWANILVIWAMSVLFMASLYTEAFPRLGRRLAVLLARQAA